MAFIKCKLEFESATGTIHELALLNTDLVERFAIEGDKVLAIYPAQGKQASEQYVLIPVKGETSAKEGLVRQLIALNLIEEPPKTT